MKALCVFSGGLDSMLASQIIRAQGIDVLGLFFETPFFSSHRAKMSAKAIQLPLKVVDMTGPHLEVVKHPAHGYGGNMNPCIDCHALMLRKAGQMLEEEGASFLITGEVLGQRPMSQNLKSLSIVATQSGFPRLILRPLSAKLLQTTLPEEKGWVQRDLLLNFSGRGRKPQMELARKLNITDYPSPAGGCLLTDPLFSKRLKDLLTRETNFETREIELMKVGRHFRLGPHTKLVVGRNKGENEIIASLAKPEDLLLFTPSAPGPTVVALGEITPETELLAARITASYSDEKEGERTEVRLSTKGDGKTLWVEKPPKSEFQNLMI
ncbi:MAG: tRNA 4-thiouridine(8) synthase ThiI [Desulfobacterota bacterium]|jgi:tRNA U34 2-thiouridine synthase MnmA/TrmU|nr:tRNA 4-thiouridine(8) synthase ThiI [Thermodesulfobacteriota bacterium]